MLRKLKRKFVLVTMAIILAMLGILFGLVYQFTKTDMEQKEMEALVQLESVAGSMMSVHDLPRDVEYPYFFVYVNEYNELFSVGYTNFDLNNEELLTELVISAAKTGTQRGMLKKYDLMFSCQQGFMSQVYIFLDVSGNHVALSALIRNFLLMGAVGIAVFLVLSIFLAKWMIRPVEKAWKQQKQFVSDASHELKTPLTVILSNAELLQNEEGDKETYTENILSMSHQMKHLVEGLLELARADNGQVRKSFETVDFSTLVSDSVLPFEPVFFEKTLELQTNIEPGIFVEGSAAHLRQVVDILLDNAGKYTDCGIIHVKMEKKGRQCLLSVSNPGTPIPQEELKAIFERFYRSDKARSRTGSFGLGLSIADSIVKEHRGKIWAISNYTGNCFFVELPCQ